MTAALACVLVVVTYGGLAALFWRQLYDLASPPITKAIHKKLPETRYAVVRGALILYKFYCIVKSLFPVVCILVVTACIFQMLRAAEPDPNDPRSILTGAALALVFVGFMAPSFLIINALQDVLDYIPDSMIEILDHALS